MTRGGKREGAGRPCVLNHPVRVLIVVEGPQLDQIDRYKEAKQFRTRLMAIRELLGLGLGVLK